VIEETEYPPELIPLDLDVPFRACLLEDKEASVVYDANEVLAMFARTSN
jgi:hypothetical protein